jgi:hypothetical protein
MNKIDAPSYERGRAAFREGKSLRDVVGFVDANDADTGVSFALGFADAALDLLRAIVR